MLTPVISDQCPFSRVTRYISPKHLLSACTPRNEFPSTPLNVHIGILISPSSAQLWLTAGKRTRHTKRHCIDNRVSQPSKPRPVPVLREPCPPSGDPGPDSETFLCLSHRCQASCSQGQLAGHLRTRGPLRSQEGSGSSAHRCSQPQRHPSGQLARCPGLASPSALFWPPRPSGLWDSQRDVRMIGSHSLLPLPETRVPLYPLTPSGLSGQGASSRKSSVTTSPDRFRPLRHPPCSSPSRLSLRGRFCDGCLPSKSQRPCGQGLCLCSLLPPRSPAQHTAAARRILGMSADE